MARKKIKLTSSTEYAPPTTMSYNDVKYWKYDII